MAAFPSSITPVCGTSGIGYTILYSNGTHYTYIIGVNATYFPPSFVVGYSILDAVLFITSLLLAGYMIYVIASGRVMSIGRLASFTAFAVALITIAALLAASPLRPVTINCGSGTYTVMSFDPMSTLDSPTVLISIITVLILVLQQLTARWGL